VPTRKEIPVEPGTHEDVLIVVDLAYAPPPPPPPPPPLPPPPIPSTETKDPKLAGTVHVPVPAVVKNTTIRAIKYLSY
jgi:hypothetical protein